MDALSDDQRFMRRALELAKQASDLGEVPVGSVVVMNNEIIGEGHNRPVSSHDPTAHAEIMAIRDACNHVDNYRLTGATLYVTLEPCIMCAGAILTSRIERLVFGARDERFGAAGTQVNLVESTFLNHQATVTAGILESVSKVLLQEFFQARR
jgi:tRNA(adenine34) deaminase